MPKVRTWTNEQLIEAVKTSTSKRQVLNKLGLREAGGNYKQLDVYIKELNLDNTHFTGCAHTKGKKFAFKPKIELKNILIENSTYNCSNSLRKRLIIENILQPKCNICQNIEWMNKPIPLELDHINGINTDNRLENLRLLCANCHAQTSNYRGKNIKKHRVYIKNQPNCLECNKLFYSKRRSQKFCSPGCANRSTQVIRNHSRKVKNRPSKEELIKMIQESNYCVVGRKFGVSDNAIRKWLKN